MILLLLAVLILAGWSPVVWSADVSPAPRVPSEVLPEYPQTPKTPPPSRMDPGIERRPQPVPDPRSAVVHPKVDPKMAIDPETAPTAMEKTKPGSSDTPPGTHSPR